MISITNYAKDYLIENLNKEKALGLYVEIIKGGCSGMQYKFSYIKSEEELSSIFFEKVDINEKYKIFIDQKALLFIIGTYLDHEKTNTGEKLVFKNPNEKNRCGCGKSFSF